MSLFDIKAVHGNYFCLFFNLLTLISILLAHFKHIYK